MVRIRQQRKQTPLTARGMHNNRLTRSNIKSFKILFTILILLCGGGIIRHALLLLGQNNNNSNGSPFFSTENKSSHNDPNNDSKRTQTQTQTNSNALSPTLTPTQIQQFQSTINQVKSTFSSRYGGDDPASALMERGVQHPEKRTIRIGETESNPKLQLKLEVARTAERILQAKEANRAFKMSFGGYSITVGRGNRFEQSYPFVMERILKAPMEALGIDLVVRNAAIGGTPSFPYGWCLKNLLGEDSDVVSWEFGLNEGNAADGMESYLRHTMIMPQAPKFLLVDKMRGRDGGPKFDILRKYADKGASIDSVLVDYESAVNPFISGKTVKPEFAAFDGFSKWDVWGGNASCPGHSSWHLKMQSHEMIGWMLAMHFVDALELAADMMQNAEKRQYLSTMSKKPSTGLKLPDPVSIGSDPDSPYASIRFGVKSGSAVKNETWQMHHISCRTSYDPILSGNLKEIVKSGVHEHEDILRKRDETLIESSWVIDVGKLERDTKIKVDNCGGLGYIDMKKALYGVSTSGLLKLEIPWQGGKEEESTISGDEARAWFKSIVICEVNEKRKGANVCKIDQDISFKIGGEEVTAVKELSFTGVSYLKQDICFTLDIPATASVERRNKDSVSLTIEAKVTNEKIPAPGACSISHVVWENM